MTGILLLGFTGGGYAGVGQPYLFTTLAAVVIGGTSLVGGRGGYGLTILGVLILTVLQTILAGFSLSAAAQEAIPGCAHHPDGRSVCPWSPPANADLVTSARGSLTRRS